MRKTLASGAVALVLITGGASAASAQTATTMPPAATQTEQKKDNSGKLGLLGLLGLAGLAWLARKEERRPRPDGRRHLDDRVQPLARPRAAGRRRHGPSSCGLPPPPWVSTRRPGAPGKGGRRSCRPLRGLSCCRSSSTSRSSASLRSTRGASISATSHSACTGRRTLASLRFVSAGRSGDVQASPRWQRPCGEVVAIAVAVCHCAERRSS